MLHAQGVYTSLQKKSILSDVSLYLDKPELVVIVGPNGAGKTTLLKTLCGELATDAGQVLFEDKAISNWPVEDLAARMAVLPQASALSFPFLVEEVVALGRYPHSTGVKADTAIVAQALYMMDIRHLSECPYNTLSGGEKQRVHIARVFAQILKTPGDNKNKVLFMDEPSSQLDIEYQHRLMLNLISLKESGVLPVVVMHDFNLAAQYADKVFVLADSCRYAFGSVEDVFIPSMFKEVFNVDASVLHNFETGRPVITSEWKPQAIV